MSYLTELANAIMDELDPDVLPSEDTDALFRIYAVLALAKGRDVTAEDVHNAWVAWMSERDASHSSIKPYAELPADVQAQDQPFADAIRAVMAKAGDGS